MDKRIEKNFLDYSDILIKNAEIVKEKGIQYGHTHKMFGSVMMALFPNGLHVKGEKSYRKFGIFMMIIHKLIRIAYKLFDEKLSTDNLTDLSNYSAMFEKIMEEDENEK